MTLRSSLLRWSATFHAASALCALIVGLRYLLLYPFPTTVLGIIYAVAAYASHLALVGFLPGLILTVPLALVVPRPRIVIPAAVFSEAILLAVLLLDSLVFAENRFHITLLTVRILGVKTGAFGLVYLVIFAALMGTVAAALWHKVQESPGQLVKAGGFGVITVILLLFTHGAHIWADATCYTPITGLTPYLPFFYPATARRMMVRWGLVPMTETRPARLSAPRSPAALRYPLEELRFEETAESLRNVLIVLLDGWRYDMLDPTCTPAISRYAARGIVCANHWSGGNSTRMGVFSLFYGLPATYWKYFDGLHRQPVLMEHLLAAGYEPAIFSSGPLYAPANLDASVFAGVPNLRMATKTAVDATWARDSAITAEWLAWHRSRTSHTPFFAFLFYGNPVERSVPPDYAYSRAGAQNGSNANRGVERYRVALHYVDSLVGVVLDDLAQSGALAQTVVLISADHGEGFDEAGVGFRGHGSAYDREQLRVPMIVLWPGRDRGVVHRRTSHYDIPATLLSGVLGCVTPPDRYCSGRSLFEGEEWEWLVVGSYYNTAIVQPDRVIVQFPGGYYEVRDSLYRIVDRANIDHRVLGAALAEMGRFFGR